MPSADHGRSLGLLAGRTLLSVLLLISSLGGVADGAPRPPAHAPAPSRTPTLTGRSNAKPGTVVESEFGLEKGGVVEGQDDPVVPLKDGVVYGWSVRLAPPYRAVHVVERLVLPGPAKWDIDAPYKRVISTDRMSCRLEMDLTPDADGRISNTWNVSADDPAGRGTCTITVGNQPPVVFRVTFVRPDKAPADPPIQESKPEAGPVEGLAPATRPAETDNIDEKAALRELDRQLDGDRTGAVPAATEPSPERSPKRVPRPSSPPAPR